MKHREIYTILILVAFAFAMVAVLSYFNLYEGFAEGADMTTPPAVPTPEPLPALPPNPPPTTSDPKKQTTSVDKPVLHPF